MDKKCGVLLIKSYGRFFRLSKMPPKKEKILRPKKEVVIQPKPKPKVGKKWKGNTGSLVTKPLFRPFYHHHPRKVFIYNANPFYYKFDPKQQKYVERKPLVQTKRPFVMLPNYNPRRAIIRRRPAPSAIIVRRGGGGKPVVWKEKIKKFMFLCTQKPVRCVKIASQYKNHEQLVSLIMEDPKWTYSLLKTLSQDDEIQDAFQESGLGKLPQDQVSLEKLAIHKQKIKPYVEFLVSRFTS